MDAKELLESLTIDEIKTILIELGAQHIEDLSQTKGHLITNTICHNISDGKMKLYYYTEGNGKYSGKMFHCFTACGDNFNIYELIKRNHELKGIEMSFRDIIGWICAKTGRKNSFYSKPEGFEHGEKVNEELEYLKQFNKKKMVIPELTVHDEVILKRFTNHHHPSFLEDNISHESMDKYQVMFNYVEHAIMIPHRHYKDGSLIGLKMRNLDEEKINAGYKYIPYQTFGENGILYSFPTYYNLYGLWENKEHIKKVKKIILFEAEKSVMQCETYYPNNNFAVALCGSNLSDTQVQMILDLGVEEVLIALDREYTDVESEECKSYQQKILRLGLQLAPYVKVSVLIDGEDRLPYKASPSDMGQSILEELMNEKQYINLISE